MPVCPVQALYEPARGLDGPARDTRAPAGAADARTLLSRRIFELMAVSVINFGRVAGSPVLRDLTGLPYLFPDAGSGRAATQGRSGAMGHNPALSGAVGHTPRTGAAHLTTSPHARNRNHKLIADAAHSSNSLRTEVACGRLWPAARVMPARGEARRSMFPPSAASGRLASVECRERPEPARAVGTFEDLVEFAQQGPRVVGPTARVGEQAAFPEGGERVRRILGVNELQHAFGAEVNVQAGLRDVAGADLRRVPVAVRGGDRGQRARLRAARGVA